jgi:predicted glycosyltransferase
MEPNDPVASATGRIWIDIDNSPHVPFFLPIIEELQKQGAEVLLTARDMYQVRELLEFFHIPCKVIGGHCGKNTLLKVLYNCARAIQLSPTAVSRRPDLALSHGSRAQVLICKALGIPTVMMHDYEHSVKTGFLEPDWFIVPEVIPGGAMSKRAEKVLKYRGLKEDVYLPRFRPDRTLFHDLGISTENLVVTVRPPATEAHYHCSETDRMFEETVRRLSSHPYVQLVVLPRNHRQNQSLRKNWPDLIASRRMLIPERPVDGLNLIWFSDLVISGGGTMNREAAALGVPVYSIFRGKLGAVDRYLAEHGRMTLIQTPQDVHTKILLTRWARPAHPETRSRLALTGIINNILTIMGGINPQPLAHKQSAAANGHR